MCDIRHTVHLDELFALSQEKRNGSLGSNHLLLVAMTVAIALLPSRSLAILGKEALPHVNDLPVHVVAPVRLLGRVHNVSFVEFLHPGRVPGTLVLVA